MKLSRVLQPVGLLAVLVFSVAPLPGVERPPQPNRTLDLPSTLVPTPGATPVDVPANYGKLPLAFEPNVGQTDPRVRFVGRAPGMTVFFTDSGVVMALGGGQDKDQQAVVRMKLAGAAKPRQAAGLEKLPGVSNYFIGNDPKKWRTDVPHYGRIEYRGVYPGVDLVCYGRQGQLEYDLVLAPWADAEQVELAWEGAESLKLNADGDVVLETAAGQVVQKRPRVEQEIGGRLVEVASKYRIVGGRRVKFELAKYDRSRRLRIDPLVLVYSTYLGGSGSSNGDQGNAIAVDAAGSAYVTGATTSADFPTAQGAYQAAPKGSTTSFVTKLTPAGNALVYSTFLGGSGTDGDFAYGIAVDGAGEAYVAGVATSADFPTTQGAFQTILKTSDGNAFVTKLAAAGNALVYSTYLGGSGFLGGDAAFAIAVDSAGSAYVTGSAGSVDFPTQSAYQPALKTSNGNAFVAKLAPAGNALVYSTYLGGSGNNNFGDTGTGIAVDSAGSAYVAGYTASTDFPITQAAFQATLKATTYGSAFVTKLAPAGNVLAYSTYLGGSREDQAYAIAVDSAGAAYVTGDTYSSDFPTTPSAFQTTLGKSQATNVFVTKLAPAGNALVYSTYLGVNVEQGRGIAVDSAGSAYVAGYTWSKNFPTQSAYQTVFKSAFQTGFVTKFTPAGDALLYSTFLGGSGVPSKPPVVGGGDQANGIALDSAGAAYVVGYAFSTDFPITPGAYQSTRKSPLGNAFVTKLTLPGSGGTYTVTTSPANLGLVIDSVSYTAPQTFTWTAGSQHTIGVASPQGSGTRFVFSNWSDSGAQTHTVTAPASSTTYTANFTTQYLLTAQASPTAGGSVTANPTSPDGYYAGGASVQLTAAPNSGYQFANWSGDLSGTANPQSLTMNASHSVTAVFNSSAAGTALYYYPVTPCRVADTRGNGKGGAFGPPSMSGGSTRAFPISTSGCGVPSTAQAYSLNVTVVPAGQLTYLTMWPTGQPQPTVSTLNDFSTQAATPGNVLANAAIVPAGTSGSVSIFVSDTSDVIIDVNGYFAAPGTGGLAFYPVTPCRVADTRGNGKSGSFGPPTMAASSNRNFPIPSSGCNVPATAQAYSLNMTVVPPGQLVYLTTWPTGQSQPVVSTLNDFSTQNSALDLGRVVANAAIVPAGTSGAVSVFVSDASDVIIDINGYFAAPGNSGALSFYTATPCRVADTRGNGFTGTFGPPSMAVNATRAFPIPVSACSIPNTAQAYSLNLTVVPPNQLTYLSTWPAGQSQPVVSTLNDFSTGTVIPGRVVANAAIVPAGTNGAVNLFTSDVTDVIIDINGYFAP